LLIFNLDVTSLIIAKVSVHPLELDLICWLSVLELIAKLDIIANKRLISILEFIILKLDCQYSITVVVVSS